MTTFLEANEALAHVEPAPSPGPDEHPAQQPLPLASGCDLREGPI
jgi:hypothetical protein